MDHLDAALLWKAKSHGDGEVIPTANTYLHQDALGSTRLVMPASMTPSFDANYVPYGMSYAMMGEETFQYTGKLLDEATHRVFLQPKLGIGLLLESNKCWLKKKLRRKRAGEP